jgi:protein-tyrosine-phosphatase
MKKNILFVCTGNSCRSVMAEGFFKYLIAKEASRFHVGSAGVSAMDGYPASAETVRVLKQNGVDVSQHSSRRLTTNMVRTADKIFVMEVMHKIAILQNWPEAREKVHLLTEYSRNARGRGLEIEIPDPIQMSETFYQNVFEVIRECVIGIAEEFGIKQQEKKI